MKERWYILKYVKRVIEFLICFISVHLFLGSIWLNSFYGHTTGDEKLFHLLVPLDGVNSECYYSYFFRAVLPSIIIGSLILLFRRKKLSKYVYIPMLIVSFTFGIYNLDIHTFIVNNVKSSSFIEDNYVEPSDVKIEFKDKKNLIYIMLESMENTYSSDKYGGAIENNLLPNLTDVALDNVSFSNTKKLGGALYLEGSNFTVASMMAQTTGMPMKVGYSKQGILDFSKFYLGTALGDILSDAGYKNYIIMGSDSKYGARDKLFSRHNYEVSDVNTAIKNKKMSSDDIVWWGYSDSDLFKYAKEDLMRISKEDEPFNYTMLTVDTHFEDGYLADECKVKYDDQYSNVISCSDSLVFEFLEWVKKQDFYDDTVIVLVGDHLSMDQDFFEDVDSNYVRTTYNVFINVDKDSEVKMKEREFAQFDMMPTTISAVGGEIKGDRLALGTNLFSDKKTLFEEYGYDYVRGELNKRSDFYNGFFAHK